MLNLIRSRLATKAFALQKLAYPSFSSAHNHSHRHKHRHQTFTTTTANMGVTKTVLAEGYGPIPKKGDEVTIEYTGYLKDSKAANHKGDKFDSSVGRGAFVTTIGVGQVIKGWDEGVTTMKVGEKATLDITSDYAYGERGYPGTIPAGADLIFDVELQKIG